MHDKWHDPDFVGRWDARMNAGNPMRREQIDIVMTAVDPSLPEGGSVLDLGVGTGLVADGILSRRSDVRLVGVDSSDAALVHARRRLAPFGDRVLLVAGDMVDDMPQGTFDAVIAVQTLHHVTEEVKDRALLHVRQRLAPTGLFAIADRLSLDTEHFGGEIEALRDRLRRRVAETHQPSSALSPEHARHDDEHRFSLTAALVWLDRGGFVATCVDLHLEGVVILARPKRAGEMSG